MNIAALARPSKEEVLLNLRSPYTAEEQARCAESYPRMREPCLRPATVEVYSPHYCKAHDWGVRGAAPCVDFWGLTYDLLRGWNIEVGVAANPPPLARLLE